MQRHSIFFALLGTALCAMNASAQRTNYTYEGARPSATTTSATTRPAEKKLTVAEISQIVAPIALYPDPLISQILMASTYPLEIVQADRWVKANKDLKGDALTASLEKQSWDASVKSLVNFPDVLSAMNDKLELTIKLGDAFIAQQADVMTSIQNLRAQAQAAGNLKSTEQQKVIVEPAPAATAPTVSSAQQTVVVEQPPAQTQIIQIQPTNPQTIYVPSYSPTVVYGSWPYPAYPPYAYYPPAPSYGSNLVSFGLGVAAGAAWGYAWGNCNWGGNDVDIDVDRNTNINNNIDRSKYKSEISNRQTARGGERGAGGQGGRSSFQHNPAHRGGVPYRDSASAQRFGGANQQASAARDSYRGRADAGRADLARGGGTGSYGGAGRTGASPSAYGGSRTGGGISGGSGSYGGSRTGGSSSYGSGGGTRSGSFDGVDRGGSAARTSSQRGQTSRSSPTYSRSAPSRSAPSRSSGGGGASRGGGGGRGGGRR